MFGVFILLSTIIYCYLKSSRHKPYKTTINGKPVLIKTGDLFSEPDWKVIPFNERFDTQVDDVIISHNSLNGIMIDNYVHDINDLTRTIDDAKKRGGHFGAPLSLYRFCRWQTAARLQVTVSSFRWMPEDGSYGGTCCPHLSVLHALRILISRHIVWTLQILQNIIILTQMDCPPNGSS